LGLADASAKLAPSGHDRSRTTVPFRIRHGDEALERMFVERAAQSGILQTFGHHSVGGQCAFPKLPKLPGTDASKLRGSVNNRRTFHDRARLRAALGAWRLHGWHAGVC
jgi:hypothetical protein